MKKNVILIIVCIISSLYAQTAIVPLGAGTQNDPYQISSLGNLFWVSNQVNYYDNTFQNKYLVQTNDIDASTTSTWFNGQGWEPIGFMESEYMYAYFSGNYDGQNHNISGLYINRPQTNYVGLFGYTNNAILTNTNINNATITGADNTGSLIGYGEYMNVLNCTFSGDIGGANYTGGVIGRSNYNYLIKNCVSQGNVTGLNNGWWIGGITGNANGRIEDCISYASVNGSGWDIAGINANNFGVMINCINYGEVIGLGGIAGENYGTISQCVNNGSGTFAGIVGVNHGTVMNSYSIGNCEKAGIAHDNEGLISGCYSIGNIIGSHIQTGGLVGCNGQTGIITQSFSKGNVSSTSDQIGGLVGLNVGTISQCYSTGNVSGSNFVGGFAGDQQQGSIDNCYSLGNVSRISGSTNEAFGGFIGRNYRRIVNNSYSIGKVIYVDSTNPINKGFVGIVSPYGSFQMNNNFWNVQNSEQNSTGGNIDQFATGLTTAQMTNIITFSNYDFENIWSIDPTKNNGYPYLKWQVFETETLPVTLSSLTGTYNSSNMVSIQWSTQSETNLLGYHIYRNTDNDLNTADRMTASPIQANNSSNTQSYSFNDSEIEMNCSYNYWLQSVNYDGSVEFFGPINVKTEQQIITPQIPSETQMYSVYPNPVKNGATPTFNVKVKNDETAILSIYNIKGQVVKTKTGINSGVHVLNWDKKDNNGKLCSNGIYFCKLTSPTYTGTKKFLLLK